MTWWILRSIAIAITLALVLVATPRAARASCATDAVALRAALVDEASAARQWNALWALGFAGAAAGQLALVATETNPIGDFDRDFEEQMYVGAAKATLGMAARFVLPLRVTVPAAATEPCEDVARLRAAIAANGRRERRTVWLTLIGGTLVNLAGSALLWHRRDLSTAAQSFATGVVVGPISAWTQPRASWRRWRAERATWAVRVGPGTLSVAGTF